MGSDGLVARLLAWKPQYRGDGDERTIPLALEAADRIQSLEAEIAEVREALKPFADCCDQIGDDESDEEWAKFRLLVKDYRAAARVILRVPVTPADREA